MSLPVLEQWSEAHKVTSVIFDDHLLSLFCERGRKISLRLLARIKVQTKPKG